MSRSRISALVLWVGAVAAWLIVSRMQGVGPIDAAESLGSLLADNWWGPVLYVVVYALRPVILFPASILTILGGLAFGPVVGVGATGTRRERSAVEAERTEVGAATAAQERDHDDDDDAEQARTAGARTGLAATGLRDAQTATSASTGCAGDPDVLAAVTPTDLDHGAEP